MLLIQKEEAERLGFIEPYPDMHDSNFVTDREFVDSLPIQDRMKILDVGCGLGRDLQTILDKYPNCECIGVDSLYFLIKRCILDVPKASFRRALANDLPFSDKYFDIVYANSLFGAVSRNMFAPIIHEMQRVGKRVFYTEAMFKVDFRRVSWP